jgi:hypothetical protein
LVGPTFNRVTFDAAPGCSFVLKQTRLGTRGPADPPTCLGTRPVAGCNCGVVVVPEDAEVEHRARVAARRRSSPGSTIRAMAGALEELASLLSWRTDETWCRDLAHDLAGFARQLPPQDGGEDVAREVRHA